MNHPKFCNIYYNKYIQQHKAVHRMDTLCTFFPPVLAGIVNEYLDVITLAERIDMDYYAEPYVPSMIGYRLTSSSNQTIEVLLSRNSLCCEVYEIMMLQSDGTVDDLNVLKNQHVISVTFGTRLICDFVYIDDIQISEECYEEIHPTNKAFVNITTNTNKYQIFAYNYHNGYYEHDIFFQVVWR